MSSKLINLEHGSNLTSELCLLGHNKSIKGVKQSFFNEKIIASCGRDGLIFIWDTRTANTNECKRFRNCGQTNISHIHVN
jgi:WD40 repeat protein